MLENLRETLVDKHDVKNSVADSLVTQIKDFSPKIMAAFEKWMSCGKIDDTEVQGLTVELILQKYPKMNVVSAYAMLSWLEKDPAEALKTFNKGEIVRK
jgi:hypothetical protein